MNSSSIDSSPRLSSVSSPQMPMELSEHNNNEPPEASSPINGSLYTHSNACRLNGNIGSHVDAEMDSEPIFDETDLTEFAEQIELESSMAAGAAATTTNSSTGASNNNSNNSSVTNGPVVVSSEVIEYFRYDDEDDDDAELDSSTCTQIEAQRTESKDVFPTPAQSPIFACDDVATLKRSSTGGKSLKSSSEHGNPSNTMTTFSVATYTSPQGNGATQTTGSSRNLTQSSHNTNNNNSSLPNGSMALESNHRGGGSAGGQSSDVEEDIFSMDEELTLKNGIEHGTGSSYRAHQAPNSPYSSAGQPTETFVIGSKSYSALASGASYLNNPFYGSNGAELQPSATPTSSNLLSGMMGQKGKLNSTDSALSLLIDSLPTSSGPAAATSNNSSLDVALSSGQQSMDMPYAIMINKDNSCPFFERRIGMSMPVKVGRAIARVRPAPDNAIFDCKVLSRNHALLWYQDGKFYLRDTCSSNGTFINNARLSSANEKSQPHELFSGDCVQFGVEVTEKKQVHSCVIATIRLFLPDGTEAKPTSVASDYSLLDEYHHQKGGSLYGPNSYLSSSLNITPSQLIELSHFIKDALHKQCLLESQLDSMKQVMAAALDSAKSGWNKLVEEDQLLSRIESLQAKLEVLLVAKASNSEGVSEDVIVETLKQELLHLISDKEKFELSSKCALAKALEEKMSALANLQSTEMELQEKEEECHKLNTMVSQNMKEMQGLVANCDKARKDVEELVAKLRQIEDEQAKLVEKFEQERAELQERVANFECRARGLDADSTALTQADDNVIKAATSAVQALTTSVASSLPGAGPCQPNRTALAAASRSLPQSTLEFESSQDSTKSKCLTDNNNAEPTLLRKYQEEIHKAKRALAGTRSQCQDFYKSTMSCLVSVDSLLAEKDAAIGSLTERVQQIASQLQTLKLCQRDQLEQLNMVLESEQEDNLRLAKEMRMLEEVIDKQNEELEKFKCDIDVLRNGQVMEKEKQKARLARVDSAIQTDADALDHGQGQASPTMVRRTARGSETDTGAGETMTNLPPTLNSLKDQLDVLIKALNKCTLADGESPETSDRETQDLCQTVFKQLNHVVWHNDRLKDENDHLAEELATIKEKFSLLSCQNDLSFCMALVPLLVIFLAVILAFYPILSFIMGTSDH